MKTGAPTPMHTYTYTHIYIYAHTYTHSPDVHDSAEHAACSVDIVFSSTCGFGSLGEGYLDAPLCVSDRDAVRSDPMCVCVCDRDAVRSDRDVI